MSEPEYYLTCECGCRDRIVSGEDYEKLHLGDPTKQALVYCEHVGRMTKKGWTIIQTEGTAVLLDRLAEAEADARE